MMDYPTYKAFIVFDVVGRGDLLCPMGLKYQGIDRRRTRKWAREQAMKEVPLLTKHLRRDGINATFREIKLERVV
jgi:hypothetical protein